MSKYNEGIATFQDYGGLSAKTRVKIKSGTTTIPPQVEAAGAGEDHIGITEYATATGTLTAVRLANTDGSYECMVTIDSAIAVGTVLYGAASGKLSDASSGSALAIALEAATADDDIIEVFMWSVKSTTAATVSVADSGGIITGTTVEAALAEAFTHIQTAQDFIPIPMGMVFESDATNMTALTGSTTPIRDMANGDTDSGVILTWAASNSDAIIFQTPLPPKLDVASDIVIHFRAKMAGATDTPTIASDVYFNEGDTKVEDVSAALSASYAEKTITIAAADVPAGAQTLTVELTPGAHTTDILYMSGIWIEHTSITLTS